LGVVIVIGPTMLDYIGNSTMYKYGLVFSYEWFIPWAFGLHITVGASSVSNGIIYWFIRAKNKRNRLTAFLIGLTSYWQLISGNEDLIWFVVFDRGLPPLSKVWWWMPQHWVVNYINPNWQWTTLHELIWIVTFNIILLLMWCIWYYKRNRKV